MSTPVEALSGGNQQKVALARWLATEPSVLILDEPTQGVDVGAKAEIHALIQELAERGLAILMISSELPEISAMSDRIAVMRGGTIVAVLSRDEATQETILALRSDTSRRRRRRAEARCATSTAVRSRSPSRSAVLGVVLAVVAPGYFSGENLTDLFLANLPVLVVALGMTLVILTGEIDISVGSTVRGLQRRGRRAGESRVCRSRSAAAGRVRSLARRSARSTARSSPTSRIPSIVVTLATMVALRDGLRWATRAHGCRTCRRLSVARADAGGISRRRVATLTALLFAALAGGCGHLAAGRAIYATGSNRTRRGWPASTRRASSAACSRSSAR